jgi:hypothetical protein
MMAKAVISWGRRPSVSRTDGDAETMSSTSVFFATQISERQLYLSQAYQNLEGNPVSRELLSGAEYRKATCLVAVPNKPLP